MLQKETDTLDKNERKVERQILKDSKYYEERIRELEIQVKAFDIMKEKDKYEKKMIGLQSQLDYAIANAAEYQS